MRARLSCGKRHRCCNAELADYRVGGVARMSTAWVGCSWLHMIVSGLVFGSIISLVSAVVLLAGTTTPLRPSVIILPRSRCQQ